MKTLILCLIVACCTPLALPACQTPAVKHAESAGEACAKVNLLQPVEGTASTLIGLAAKVLLNGASKASIDEGLASVKTDASALVPTLEAGAFNCAVQAAVAAFTADSQSLAGGDARLMTAATLGRKYLTGAK